MRRGSAQGGDVAAESGNGKTWDTSFKEVAKSWLPLALQDDTELHQ